ncbi:MAG TPA: polysaccharide deacetylase family protein [Solirubrobacterales bacterium]|nr:polysaccharide deacetylase family protein [Solirubrobacterales bacterium]
MTGLSLTFDNLGEAAELEAGAVIAELGRHFTATRVVPEILAMLAARGLAATFFVEGLNAELYPDLLREIDAQGHEVAFHAWRHEQWGDLTAAEQAENLARGIAGFERLGLAIAGMRPPGGSLGAGGLGVLRDAGLRYCSPAGAGAGEKGGIALLPFQWRNVDAACTLPGLGAAREQISGSSDPVEPATFVASLSAEIDALAERREWIAIVLHPVMLDWLGREHLAALLDRVASTVADDAIWVGRCADAADLVLADPVPFRNGTVLDSAGWT